MNSQTGNEDHATKVGYKEETPAQPIDGAQENCKTEAGRGQISELQLLSHERRSDRSFYWLTNAASHQHSIERAMAR
jgi:hypothetical protein